MDVLAHPDPFILEAALLDRVAEIKAADPLARILVLVPTRRLAEHVLRRAAARFGALLGLDVRHHRALVLELLEEAGEAPALAPRAARQHLLERVLEGLPGNTWAAYAQETPAAVRAILSSFEDLREAGIGPEALESAAGPNDRPLAEAYHAYVEALRAAGLRRIVDDAGLVEAALPYVPPRAGRYAAVLHHGAYELTGVYLDLLQALDGPSRVTFLAPFHPGAPATAYAEAFARRHLLAAGAEAHMLPDGPGAVLGPGLPHLWVENGPAFRAPEGTLTLTDVQGPEAELTYGLRRALAAVAPADGVPPTEVAVLARSLAPYRTVLEADEAPLPLTSSIALPLRRDPYVHDLLLLLEIVRTDFPRGRTAEALRSPRLRWGVRAESADAWSRRAAIVGGLEAWVEDLPLAASELRIAEDASAEERAEEERRAEERRHRAEAVAGALADLARAVAPARACTFPEHVDGIAALARRMLRPPETEAGPLEDALALLRGLRLLPELLGEDRRVAFAEAVRAFEQAVDAAVRRPLRQDGGGLRLLDAMQARGLTFEHVVLLGWHADALPAPPGEDVVLPDRLRERLRARTGRPLPVRADAGDEERLLAVAVLGSARRSVEVVRQRADAAGRTRSGSAFLRETARLALGEPDLQGWLARSCTLHAGPVGWLSDLAKRAGGLSPEEGTLHAALCAPSPASFRDELPREHPLVAGLTLLAATESFTPDAGEFDGRTGQPYVGRVSASALETLGKCPLRFFFQRVLRVRALEEEAGMEALGGNVLGLAVHEVLERLYARLLEEGALGWDEEEGARQVGALLPPIWSEVVGPIVERRARRLPGLWGGVTARWLAALRAFVLDDLERLRAQGTTELALEVEVEADLDLGGNRILPLRGRVDRLARGGGLLRVGDYKTGKNLTYIVEPKNFVTANALQVPLYARMTGADHVELLGVGPHHAGRRVDERRVVVPSLGPLEAGFMETLGVLQVLLARGAYPLHEDGPCGWCDYRRACRRTHPPTLAREKARPDACDFRDVKDKTAVQRTMLEDVRRKGRGRRTEVPA